MTADRGPVAREYLGALVGSDRDKGHTSAIGLTNCVRKVYAQLEDDPLFRRLKDGPLHAARHLDQITVPARIIVGARDRAFFKACQMLAAKLPGVSKDGLAVLDGCGHMVAEKNPNLFNAALLRHLDELVATPKPKL